MAISYARATARLDRLAAFDAEKRQNIKFTVLVGFNEAEHRYYVLNSDIPGLHVEMATFEEFVEVTKDFAPELIGDRAAGAKIEFTREVALA